MTQEDQNLQSLFANLNQVSRNSMIREKVGGGTGGGSDVIEGGLDPNTLMTGNPYIAKNVIEFNQGGRPSLEITDPITGNKRRIHHTSDEAIALGLGPDYVGPFREHLNKRKSGEIKGTYVGDSKPLPNNPAPIRRDDVFASNSTSNVMTDKYAPLMFNQGGMVGASGAPTMNNPYLEKVNQLVGLQQMMNVGKGLMRNTLQQEAMMSAPKANKGMRIPRYNEGGTGLVSGSGGGAKYITPEQAAADRLKYGPGNVEIIDNTTGEIRRISSKSDEFKELQKTNNPYTKYGAAEDWDVEKGYLWNMIRNPLKPMMEGESIRTPVEGGIDGRPAWTWDTSNIGRRWGDVAPGLYPGYNPPIQDQYAPIAPPMANKGMKMKKRYTNGGRF